MKRGWDLLTAGALALAMIAVFAGQGRSATTEGAIITNVASATVAPFAGVPSGEVTYSVTATVMVATPMIVLAKTANVTVQSPGGDVTFCMTVINESLYTSAFNVVVSDWIPDNMVYTGFSTEWVRGAGAINYRWYAPPPADMWFGWGSRPNPGASADGLIVWHVDVVGPGRSGYLCYRASVE